MNSLQTPQSISGSRIEGACNDYMDISIKST